MTFEYPDLGPLLNDDGVSEATKVTWVIQQIGYALVFTVNAAALAVTFSKKELYKSISVQLLLMPMICECIKCTGVLVAAAMTTVSQEVWVRYVACQFLGFTCVFGYSLSLFSVVNLAVDRYFVVKRGHAYSQRFMILSACATVVSSSPLASLYMIIGTHYVPSPCRTYCIAPWSSTDLADRILNLICILFIAGAIGVILCLQLVLFKFVRDVQRDVKSAQNFSLSHTPAEVREHQALFWRFFGISFVMVLAWTPIFIVMIHGYVTNTDLSAAIDSVVSNLSIYSSLPITAVLVLFTPALRAEIERRLDSFCKSVMMVKKRKADVAPQGEAMVSLKANEVKAVVDIRVTSHGSPEDLDSPCAADHMSPEQYGTLTIQASTENLLVSGGSRSSLHQNQAET